jgi:hypothetical protein
MTPSTDLPALPEPADELAEADGFNVIGLAPVFTAEQMHAYARAALAASAPSRAGETQEGGTLEENVRVLLDRCPHTVRSREGGGLEDLTASLVITFIKMQNALAERVATLPAQPEVRWCTSCGEGVTTFCRGADKSACEMFSAQPEVREAPSESALMQILHDPENQPSQYGTVPVGWGDKRAEVREALTDEQCDDVIDRLDQIARDHDNYEYGLPISNDELRQPMRDAVRGIAQPTGHGEQEGGNG